MAETTFSFYCQVCEVGVRFLDHFSSPFSSFLSSSFPGYDLLMPKHSEDVSIYMTELWLIEETIKMTNAMVFPGEISLRDTTMHSHIGRNF